MYNAAESSSYSFSTIRATWEARQSVVNKSPTEPLLPTATKKLSTTTFKQVPNGVRRLSHKSFGMFNGQFNPFRSKFARGLQPSDDGASLSKASFATFSDRNVSNPAFNIVSDTPNTVLNTEISYIPSSAIPRSRTMSFLPVPIKSRTSPRKGERRDNPKLVNSQSSAALHRSRIPTPHQGRSQTIPEFKHATRSQALADLPKSSSARLQRSSTQPVLSSKAGRRGSEFPRNMGTQQISPEEAVPLLESDEDEDAASRESKLWSSSDIDAGLEALPWRNRQSPCLLSSPKSARLTQLDFEPVATTVMLDDENMDTPLTPRPRRVMSVSFTPPQTPPTARALRTVRKSEPLPFTSQRIVQTSRLLSPIHPRNLTVSVTDPNLSGSYPQEKRQSTPAFPLSDANSSSPYRHSRSRYVYSEKPREEELASAQSSGNLFVDDPENLHLISKAKPSAYWAGRYISLKDRLLNENFNSIPTSITTTCTHTSSAKSSTSTLVFLKTDASSYVSPTTQQTVQIFDKLTECCTTDSARLSLWSFQNEWCTEKGIVDGTRFIPEAAMKGPNPLIGELDSNGDGKSSWGTCNLSGSQDKSRKMSFMDRMRMMGRKSSGKSEKSNAGETDKKPSLYLV